MVMSIQEFVESQRGHTSLAWLAGKAGATRRLGDAERSTVDRVGYLNVIHLGRVGVMGPHEVAWFNRLDSDGRSRLLAAMTEAHPPALIISDGMPAPEELTTYCDEVGLPLFGSPLAAPMIIESLRYFLSQETQDTTSLHGVMMDVLGMGLLISGESGLGKSELALELISRGHGLVADDVVEIHRLGPSALECRCPPLLQGLLEVRGLGLLDIKTVFGETAVRRKMRLKLIVHLVRQQTMDSQYERMPLQELTQDILGVPVRKVVIPVAAGRNLAVLTEAAVRSTVLLLRGIDTTRDFIERQQRAIRESSGLRDDDF